MIETTNEILVSVCVDFKYCITKYTLVVSNQLNKIKLKTKLSTNISTEKIIKDMCSIIFNC